MTTLPYLAERFRFFGQDVLLLTDEPTVVATLSRVYERHLVQTSAPAGSATTSPGDIVVRVAAGAEGVGPAIYIGERTVRVPAANQLGHYAHLVMVNVAAAAATDQIVLHAGAAERGGRAALIVGRSGWGKTTLTLALAGRGWNLLSDDFAPVDGAGVVTAFPRRVSITEPSLALLGIAPPPDTPLLVGFGGERKWMLDIEELFPGRLGTSATVAAVFLLGEQAPVSAAHEPPRWRIQLDHLTPGLASALTEIPGVTAVTPIETAGPPVVDLHLARGALVVGALDEACRAHDTAVLSADRLPSSQPTFGPAPMAEPIELRAALAQVMANAVSLSGRRFLRTVDPTLAMRELAFLHRALGGVGTRVFHLRPGGLSQTAALVEQLTFAEEVAGAPGVGAKTPAT